MTLNPRHFLLKSFWLRMAYAWFIVCMALPPVAFSFTSVQGTDGSQGYSGEVLVDSTTMAGYCSQAARGPVVSFPNATGTLNSCSSNTIVATDIGQTATGIGVIAVSNADGDLNAWNSQGGLSWIQRKSVADVTWQSVVRSPALGLWVAVASTLGSTHVMTSPNGIDWTAQTAPDQPWVSVAVGYPAGVETLVAVAYGPGHFNRVMYSTNGTSWTNGYLPADYNWVTVVWSGAQFVALTNNGTTTSIATSANGSTWTPITTPASDVAWQKMGTDGAGKLVAVGFTGTAGHVMVSTDHGATWTQNAGLDVRSWNGVAWSAKLSQWVAVSNGGGTDDKRIAYSSNAVSWTQILPPSLMSFGQVIYGDQWVATAGASGQERVATSPDGKVWRLSQPATQSSWSSVAWAPNQYVAVAVGGVGNRVMTSGLLADSTTTLPTPLSTQTAVGTVSGTGTKTLAITRSTYTATWASVQSVTFTATGTGTGTGTTTTTGTITGSAYGTASNGGTLTGTVTVTATGTGSGTSTATVSHVSVGNASSAPALFSQGSSSQAQFDDSGNLSTTGTIKADTGLASRTSAEFGGAQGAAISMFHDSYSSEIGFNLRYGPNGFTYGPGSSGQYVGYMQFDTLTGQWKFVSSLQAANAGVNWQQYPLTANTLLLLDKLGNGTFAGKVTGQTAAFGSSGQFTVDTGGNGITSGVLYATGAPPVAGWPMIQAQNNNGNDVSVLQVANDAGYTAGQIQAFGSAYAGNAFPSAVGAANDSGKLVFNGQGTITTFKEMQIGTSNAIPLGFFTNNVERGYFQSSGSLVLINNVVAPNIVNNHASSLMPTSTVTSTSTSTWIGVGQVSVAWAANSYTLEVHTSAEVQSGGASATCCIRLVLDVAGANTPIGPASMCASPATGTNQMVNIPWSQNVTAGTHTVDLQVQILTAGQSCIIPTNKASLLAKAIPVN